MSIQYQVLQTWLKALVDQILCYLEVQYLLLTALYSLADPEEIYLVSNIYVVIDIILRRKMKKKLNISILLISSLDGRKYWNNCQLSLPGYIILLFMKLNHILWWSKKLLIQNILLFGMSGWSSWVNNNMKNY